MAEAKEKFPGAGQFMPAKQDLSHLRTAAKDCQGCDLYRNASQAVFGEGAARAEILMVGEQPGDVEDRRGHVFVGPAGRILDKALATVGLSRQTVYVTNAVKHFKWVATTGKRRLHAKPSARQAAACRPWLAAEIVAVKPKMIICLGATAAATLLGPKFRLTQHRGEIMPFDLAPWIMATIHPSAVLRQVDDESRHRAEAEFTNDLAKAVDRLRER